MKTESKRKKRHEKMTWDLSKNGLARTCVTIESAEARDEKEKKKHDELIQSARARIVMPARS